MNNAFADATGSVLEKLREWASAAAFYVTCGKEIHAVSVHPANFSIHLASQKAAPDAVWSIHSEVRIPANRRHEPRLAKGHRREKLESYSLNVDTLFELRQLICSTNGSKEKILARTGCSQMKLTRLLIYNRFETLCNGRLQNLALIFRTPDEVIFAGINDIVFRLESLF